MKPEVRHHKRQMMIHKHSSMVMPFDMNKVTHYFVKTNDGGVLIQFNKVNWCPLVAEFIADHFAMAA